MIGNINAVSGYQTLNPIENKSGASKNISNVNYILTGDYVDVSHSALELSRISALKSVNGKTINELRAINNVLTLNAGEYYGLKLPNGLNMVVHSITVNNGYLPRIGVPYEEIFKEIGMDFNNIAPPTIGVYNRMQRFLTCLNQPSLYGLITEFSDSERLERFDMIGIKPGGWVEINNQNSINRFYLDYDGLVWSEEQSENARLCLNTNDYRREGCTADSVFIVNGKEYKMDENGHFNVPEGEPVIWGRNVVPPKEMGEYNRAKVAASLVDKSERGISWSENQIGNAISAFTHYDWREQGCTADSVLVVDGKEYKIDENGHFNVDESAPGLETHTVVMPKEVGEHLRAK